MNTPLRFLLILLISGFTTAAGEQPGLLTTRGKLLFSDDFSAAKVADIWTTAKGKWEIVDGALRGTEMKADQHTAVVRTDIELPATFALQFDFRFDGGKTIHCSFNGKGHICRATLTPEGFTLKGDKDKKDPKDKPATVGQVQQTFEQGKWYTMLVEVDGEEMVARVGDGPIAFGSDAKIARDKNNLGFPTAGVSSYDNLKIWAATSNPSWAATKAKLPANKIIPPTPPPPAERFAKMDADGNNQLSLKEFIGKRPKSARAAAESGFKKRDKDASGSLSLAEYAPVRKKK
jgi:hypothetical protein